MYALLGFHGYYLHTVVVIGIHRRQLDLIRSTRAEVDFLIPEDLGEMNSQTKTDTLFYLVSGVCTCIYIQHVTCRLNDSNSYIEV